MNILVMMMVLAEAATDPGLWVSIVDLAVQILTPILLVVGSWAAVKLAKKFNMEALVADNELARETVRAGIGYAERRAKKWAADNDAKATGPQKLSWAVKHVAKIAGKLNVGEKIADGISRRIHAEFGMADLVAERDVATATQINLDGVLGIPSSQPES